MGPHEHEPKPSYTIEPMTIHDLDDSTRMRMQSWLDTYVNDEFGVTEEWVRERYEGKFSPETFTARVQRFKTAKEKGTLNAWVARDAGGSLIGSTTPYVTEDGLQRLGSLYVDKKAHGSGVASELMQRVVDWFDPEKPIYLEVVSYNERAKAFYRKWGFEEIPGSEKIFADLIPDVTMIRQPQNNQSQGEA